MTVLALVYLAIVGTWQIVATNFAKFEAALIQRVADSVTFGTSAMLLAALCNKPTLIAFGDTRPFLFFAGLTGFIYAVVVARLKP